MRLVALLFSLATIFVATCHGFQTSPLRLKSGLDGPYIPVVSCSSWRLGVEAHNIIDWKTIPKECEGYVGNYVLGKRYRDDSKQVAREAYFYAKSLNLAGCGKDIWVFDIDETSLSNVPYYAEHGFGVEPLNATSFTEWAELAIAPALPESLKLYRKLLSLGFKIVFLTGRPESVRDVTAKNLKYAGYYTWEKLILKDIIEYEGQTSVQFKSHERKKLVREGYRIIGNIGDQWSDLLGTNTGKRTFKLPNPMYFVS